MSEPRPPRISPVTYLATFIPGLLVIVAAVLLLWATPRSIEAISHQRTVRQVQEANFRLNEPSIPTQATTFLEQLNRASRDVATLVRPSVVHISAQEETDPRTASGTTEVDAIWDDQDVVSMDQLACGRRRESRRSPGPRRHGSRPPLSDASKFTYGHGHTHLQ